MIYIPYTIHLVTELDETHPTSQQILEFGEEAQTWLSELFEELLVEKVLPELNEGNTYARVLTLESAIAEDLISETENYLREQTKA